MKKLLHFYQFIVGGKYGFTGEGNEQWYYTLALVINIMLVWWLCPEIGTIFSILASIHYLTVVYHGVFSTDDIAYNNPTRAYVRSYLYFGGHAVMFIIAAIVNIKWAIITSVITTVAVLIAPDCTGNNIFLRKPNVRNNLPLLFNTIMFASFVLVDFLLPIRLWIKFVLLVIFMVLHPFIDFIEGECIIISDVTYEAWECIRQSLKSKKKK
ncbi:MAG: hypothetical protein IJ272_05215 [Clostridia bacterium]|nr:hypothetical protein [Clostridia bacterium]